MGEVKRYLVGMQEQFLKNLIIQHAHLVMKMFPPPCLHETLD